jgi:hypothetical protein
VASEDILAFIDENEEREEIYPAVPRPVTVEVSCVVK